MYKFTSSFKHFSLSVVLGSAIGFLLTGYVVFAAFQPPTADPPGANVPAPLNVGPDGQTKLGGIALNDSGSVSDGLIILKGAYIQLGLTATPPVSADCNAVSERGRMIVEIVNNILWVCMNSGCEAK